MRSEHDFWYIGEMNAAEARFGPLARELEQRLEVKTSVDQTGGMVMCLRVPVGRKLDAHGDTRKYAWFSELCEYGDGFEIGMGLYENDEWGDLLDDGEFVEWPGPGFLPMLGTTGWRHHPQLCADVAEWAAPIIVDFATRGATT